MTKQFCLLLEIQRPQLLKKYSKNKIIVADEPDKNNLVEKAIEYFS